MKTERKAIIDMVSQLAGINEQRKALEKAEKEIKGVLRQFMADDAVLEAGEYLVLIELKRRTDLDKKAILIEMGQEFITRFSRINEFETMTVKSLKRGEE